MELLNAGAGKMGLHLSPEQLEQFSIYYQELVDWNQRMNLTAITDYEDVQVKHFLDSLSITLALKGATGCGFSVIDVGTGAGLPGIPLRILWPDIKLTLLEATAKKADFLYHLKSRLGLDNLEIVVGRAEGIAHETEYREKYDLVIARAVAAMPTLVELTLPFCVVGGSFVAQKKGSVEREVEQAARAIELLGGKLGEVKKIELAELPDERWLIAIDKISLTPQEYPRRPGIPAKRPLLR